MTTSGGVRARVRAELTTEIKAAARAELAVSGSAGLSLRAVARRLEMVPSALYRYFDSRDALLTGLILDAYGALGASAAAADVPGRSPLRRWLEVGRAVRAWAIGHPAEWALIYGSPVPGYEAPADTIEVGLGVVSVLTSILRDGASTTPDGWPVAPPVGRELHRWLVLVREPYLVDLPDGLVALALVAYTHLLGAVSLELFGQYGREATPAPAIFEHGLLVTATLVGLRASP